MISEYDLYDLRMIFVAIRSYPNDKINKMIVSNIVEVLNDGLLNDNTNPIRRKLGSIASIDERTIYDFVFSDCKYTYYSLPYLKDQRVFDVLLASLKEMIIALNEENQERIVDLSDCLHNLPILLVKNRYSIPKEYWRITVKHYRKKWNNTFLLREQKALKEKRSIRGRLA